MRLNTQMYIMSDIHLRTTETALSKLNWQLVPIND